MGEIAIEQAACDKIKRGLGVENLKLNVQGRRGWPDRLFWVPGGRPLLIEFKAPGGKSTPLQLHIHQKLRTLGYEVQIHDTVIGAYNAIAGALRRATPMGAGGVPKEGG